jgi:hypothetical protein
MSPRTDALAGCARVYVRRIEVGRHSRFSITPLAAHRMPQYFSRPHRAKTVRVLARTRGRSATNLFIMMGRTVAARAMLRPGSRLLLHGLLLVQISADRHRYIGVHGAVTLLDVLDDSVLVDDDVRALRSLIRFVLDVVALEDAVFLQHLRSCR